MYPGDWQLTWVVCHNVTRSVSSWMVLCPLRGRVSGATCLDCRLLTTSSIERSGGPWCELPTPIVGVATITASPERPGRVPEAGWRVNLPVMVAPRVAVAHAVRPLAAMPSGHPIGT